MEVFCHASIASERGEIVMFFRRRRQERREHERQAQRQHRHAELLAQLEAAEAGDQDSLQCFYHLYGRDREQLSNKELERVDEVKSKFEAQKALPSERANLQRFCARYQEVKGTPEEITALRNIVYELRQCQRRNLALIEKAIRLTLAEVSELLKAAVRSRYEELIAGREDRDAFVELKELINRTRMRRKTQLHNLEKGDLKKVGIEPLAYPDDWNILAARHFDTPSIGFFWDLPARSPGHVRLLAAEAVRADDFTEAQIALAYCNDDDEFRAAVGDVLTAELAKLVTEHRAKMRSTVDQVE